MSEPDFLVLHTLRLKGFAEVDAVADATGLSSNEVSKHIEVFETDGLVIHRAGTVSGWTLTEAGRAEDERRAAAEIEAAGLRPAIEHAYDEFLAHNGDVLQLCTDWQLRGTGGAATVNDHRDEAYDEAVIHRLVTINHSIRPVTDELAASLARFENYGPRLSTAVDRVLRGEKDWFTRPTIDSYHTVWFELHENLLATLRIERGKETS